MMATIKEQAMRSVDEDAEKLEPLCTVDGNANLCDYCEKQYGVSPKT